MGVNKNNSYLGVAYMVSGKHFRKREAILSYLRQTDTHPSAEMVFAQLKDEYPDLSLGTVYRNLGIFKEQGLIQSLGTVNGVERFDGNVNPHVHFACVQCDAVLDLPELDIPRRLPSQAMKLVGGRVDSFQLTFSGICGECANEKLQGGETV